MIVTFIQDPAARLDYQMTWADFLGTDTILTSSWASTPPGLVLEDIGILPGAKSTAVWCSGGVVGQVYMVTNHIVTADTRINEGSFKLNLLQR